MRRGQLPTAAAATSPWTAYKERAAATPYPSGKHPINHHVPDPAANPRVEDRDKPRRPRAITHPANPAHAPPTPTPNTDHIPRRSRQPRPAQISSRRRRISSQSFASSRLADARSVRSRIVAWLSATPPAASGATIDEPAAATSPRLPVWLLLTLHGDKLDRKPTALRNGRTALATRSSRQGQARQFLHAAATQRTRRNSPASTTGRTQLGLASWSFVKVRLWPVSLNE